MPHRVINKLVEKLVEGRLWAKIIFVFIAILLFFLYMFYTAR